MEALPLAPDAPSTPSEMPSGDVYVGVALDLPVDHLFTYRVPERWRDKIAVGTRVRVPFRRRRLVGMVAEVVSRCEFARVLDVEDVPDGEPLLPSDLVSLGRWIARYYGCALGEALAAMLPRGVRTRERRAVVRRARLARDAAEAVAYADSLPAARNAQARTLRLLAKEPEGVLVAEIVKRAKVSESPLRSLAKAGWIAVETEAAPVDALLEAARVEVPSEGPPPVANEAQAKAIEAVKAAVAKGAFAPFLLLGVTGSGKTEVYLRGIEACVAGGRQAIVLVPEIALTPQTVRRFKARFPRVAVLHSAMTEADRAARWRSIRAGEADVVIGPRSAVFAPVPRLGLLVLDEEHETSFKQQNAPRYHARDVGLVRAKEAGAVVVLGTATPSLEAWHNANEGRFALLSLPERVLGRPLPPVRIVDLRTDGERRGNGLALSRTLAARLKGVLAEGGQAILFLNRRGFSTSVACPRCGYVLRCPDCSVSLTYHRSDRVGLCHLCGHEERPPVACPDCAFPSLRYRGAGTQSVEEEVRRTFPDARVARMDSDTMTGKTAYEEVLGRFARREVDVLLGTQMIAKGLHFPAVTLVGVVSADTSLDLPDFRAAERTFALVAQVAGRAGRGDAAGEVIVQTLHPDDPSIRAAAGHDYAAFAAGELASRKEHGYPPFRRLLRTVLRSRSLPALDARANDLAARLRSAAVDGVEVLGPAAPAIPRIEGFLRRHILVKGASPAAIRQALAVLRSPPTGPKSVDEQHDVDPVGLL